MSSFDMYDHFVICRYTWYKHVDWILVKKDILVLILVRETLTRANTRHLKIRTPFMQMTRCPDPSNHIGRTPEYVPSQRILVFESKNFQTSHWKNSRNSTRGSFSSILRTTMTNLFISFPMILLLWRSQCRILIPDRIKRLSIIRYWWR